MSRSARRDVFSIASGKSRKSSRISRSLFTWRSAFLVSNFPAASRCVCSRMQVKTSSTSRPYGFAYCTPFVASNGNRFACARSIRSRLICCSPRMKCRWISTKIFSRPKVSISNLARSAQFWGAHASRVLARASSPSRTFLDALNRFRVVNVSKDCFGATPKPTSGTDALPRNVTKPCAN